MRLLTHNALTNNSAAAKGNGYPLKIMAKVVRVDDADNTAVSDEQRQRQMMFVKGVLPSLDWGALVKAAAELGIPTLPHTLTAEMADDVDFCKALYHVLMNVHLMEGMLRCPVTKREFPVLDGIPNMMLEEDECHAVRM
mmetsp:Transcript_7831/g.10266  ORF Transcript_7831/g.10266 Transcript_7831/m.10266 type:complete len:139 (-) Transcript_7831:316-732(-)|eukprot:CAMPEP_0198141686 /NCGR_PEP_ID=MMETSP1443-20131203/4645_1 /TAXON_ID=186043 /ORGANISM="Entomoneis sp., Strain CCMP2396" /LENGTH=138 /DNA_ID=CAMNT_0043804501 /DNA_START=277 /DNA_END=693 /DNA_ORIENTATION=-